MIVPDDGGQDILADGTRKNIARILTLEFHLLIFIFIIKLIFLLLNPLPFSTRLRLLLRLLLRAFLQGPQGVVIYGVRLGKSVVEDQPDLPPLVEVL